MKRLRPDQCSVKYCNGHAGQRHWMCLSCRVLSRKVFAAGLFTAGLVVGLVKAIPAITAALRAIR